jgi:hypothetical protein
MRSVFAPEARWRPDVVWMWTGKLDEGALLQRLREVEAQGFGGVIVRAGFWMAPAWSSDAWIEMVRAVARECGRRGLRLWLGDEGAGSTGAVDPANGGAARSGTAGGQVAREWAEMQAHSLRFSIEDISRADIARGALGTWKPTPPQGDLLACIASPLVNRKLDFARSVTLSQQSPDRYASLLARMDSDVRVLSFTQTREGYVDLLNPEATSRFLRASHEKLREALGDDWKYLHGFWLQSPTLRGDSARKATASNPVPREDVSRFPFSPLMLDTFAERPGYELLEWLPALVADVGDDASRLRQDFWETLGLMSRESFFEPLSQWSLANGKQYAGWLSQGQPINASVSHQADVFQTLRTLPVPTVDSPGVSPLAEESALDLGRALHARLCSSAAALRGSLSSDGEPVRVMAEAWRGAGWAATLNDRVPSLHHLLRQGVNALAPSSLWQNAREEAPFFAPPSELQQPYSAAWPGFNDYIARQSWLLSRGRNGARVALLWPIRSAHAHHHPRGHRLTRWVEEDLHATALMLDDLHFEFLFVSEEDLLSGAWTRQIPEGTPPVDDGAQPSGTAIWECGQAQHPFELIVMPSVTTLRRATWKKLEGFVEFGGKVASLGLLPRYSEKGRDLVFEEAISKATMLTVGDIYDAYAMLEDAGDTLEGAATYPITRDHASGGRFSCYQPRLTDSVHDALLSVRRILKESITPELETQASDILFTRRVLAPTEPLLPKQAEILSESPAREEAAPNEPGAEEEASATESSLLSNGTEEFNWDRPFDWSEDEPPEDSTSNEVAEEDSESEDGAPLALPQLNDPAPEPAPRGGELFWIYNAAPGPQRCNVRLRPRQEGRPHSIDAWSGEVKPLSVYTQFPEIEGGGLSVGLELAPYESRALWIAPFSEAKPASTAHIEAATWTVEGFDGRVARGYATESGTPRTALRREGKLERITGEPVEVPSPLLLPDAWQAARTGPNALVLPQWEWQRGRHLPGDGRRLFGRDQWQSLPEAGMGTESAARLDVSGIITLRTSFEVAQTPGSLSLPLAPLDVPYDLHLNGDLVDECSPPWASQPPYNEPSWSWFDLEPWLRAGENTLSCIVDCREKSAADPSLSAMFSTRTPHTPRLVGDFDLTSTGALTAPQALVLAGDSWHLQGLPFYSGAVDYRQWIKAPPEWNRCRVFLEVSRCRDAVGLWLNGRFVGQRVAAPFRFDITKWLLKNASNELRLRVWNSGEAFFGPRAQEPQPSGLLGPVRIVAYPILTPLL